MSNILSTEIKVQKKQARISEWYQEGGQGLAKSRKDKAKDRLTF